MKRLLRRLHTAQTRGQSLVEMAIIAPILIFFLLGIFEVGWALRNYLVLVNVNREITRFAIRPGYVDFSSEGARDASYQRIRDWARTVASDQIDLDFEHKSTLIISHLVIDTGQPCEDMSTCQCEWFDPTSSLYDPSKAFTKDDIIIHPGMPNYKYQSITYGITQTVTGVKESRLNYDALTARLAEQNNKFNCDVMKKGGLPSANNLIATELFQDEPQLFGFPIISNPFTDPLPLYTHTVMRLIGGARASGKVEGSLIANIDAIGQVCFAYPFIVNQAELDGPPPATIGSPINILDEGVLSNDKGWVAWDQNNDSEADLTYELKFPQMSVNSYKEPGSDDQALNPGDGVASLPGGHLGQVKALVEALQGQEIIVPVYSTPPTAGVYTVDRFIKVIVQDVTGSKVNASYQGDAPDGCNSPES